MARKAAASAKNTDSPPSIPAATLAATPTRDRDRPGGGCRHPGAEDAAGAAASLVVVTHDPGVAARCSRTLHMTDGRIQGSATRRAAPHERRFGTVRLTVMLARPSRQGRAALVRPIVAFGVTTALLLVVGGGVGMFFTDPRAAGEMQIICRALSALALVLLTVPIATLAAAARLSARRRNDRLATAPPRRRDGRGQRDDGRRSGRPRSSAASWASVCTRRCCPWWDCCCSSVGPVAAAALWTGAGTAAGAVVGVVVVATASAAPSLRRVQLTPLGVARRTAPPRRRTAALEPGVRRSSPWRRR
jgi:hypothetical protein